MHELWRIRRQPGAHLQLLLPWHSPRWHVSPNLRCASSSHLGGISAASRSHLGVISASSRRHLGVISAASRRHLGGISAASRRHGVSRAHLGCISGVSRAREAVGRVVVGPLEPALDDLRKDLACRKMGRELAPSVTVRGFAMHTRGHVLTVEVRLVTARVGPLAVAVVLLPRAHHRRLRGGECGSRGRATRVCARDGAQWRRLARGCGYVGEVKVEAALCVQVAVLLGAVVHAQVAVARDL